MSPGPVDLIDDRLLVDLILGGLSEIINRGDPTRRVATTSLWYYRACRASVLGAGGQLSGPFARLDAVHQTKATTQLLQLSDNVELATPRATVPAMAQLASRHPQLNLLNLEAAASASVLGATVVLSTKAAKGVLPSVLEDENIPWRVSSAE